MINLPNFEFETKLHKQGYQNVAGVDEVGRGPLAGPVYAAAVILSPGKFRRDLMIAKSYLLKIVILFWNRYLSTLTSPSRAPQNGK